MASMVRWKLVRSLSVAACVFAARVAVAGDCLGVNDRLSVASHANAFFAVVDNYTADASSGRIDLHLTQIVVVKGRVPAKVSLHPKDVSIQLARYLFFTQDDGIVFQCSGSRPIRTSDFAATWSQIQHRTAAPPLPVAAVGSNFCRNGPRKEVMLYDDGTIVIEQGASKVTKRVDRPRVAEIRQLQARLRESPEGVGWLSYVPDGLQELTLYLDWDESWGATPTYSKCGPTNQFANRYLTPRKNAIVEAILSAAGERDAFAGCGCVE